MEPEVIAALVGTPTVLVASAAAWFAGRAQARGAYHGAVDAVRRAAQREAYADLYRSARRFISAWEQVRAAVSRVPFPPSPPLPSMPPPHVNKLWNELLEAMDVLENAVDMVRLEGPDNIAQLADRIWDSSRRLSGLRGRPDDPRPLTPASLRTSGDHERNLRNESLAAFRRAHANLAVAARAYLNGGPSR